MGQPPQTNLGRTLRVDNYVVLFMFSVLESQKSDRPLQDQVQTTKHPKDHHAFRVFSTPTPHRSYQVYIQLNLQ